MFFVRLLDVVVALAAKLFLSIYTPEQHDRSKNTPRAQWQHFSDPWHAFWIKSPTPNSAFAFPRWIRKFQKFPLLHYACKVFASNSKWILWAASDESFESDSLTPQIDRQVWNEDIIFLQSAKQTKFLSVPVRRLSVNPGQPGATPRNAITSLVPFSMACLLIYFAPSSGGSGALMSSEANPK